MALFPKTPGVYIEEIPRFPASVAAVPTSVPVFIGYTEKAEKDSDPDALFNTAVRIESLLQFQTIFGGARNETFTAVLSGPEVDVALTKTTSGDPYRLFYHMLMYFGNGGGPCYIIAVGKFPTDSISKDDFLAGIAIAEQVDEITMVVIPEAITLGITPVNNRGAVYDAMLAHCAKMQDRFALMDVEVFHGNTPSTDNIANDALRFRNNTIGANNLSYGAAYYPSIDPTLGFAYLNTGVTVNASAPSLPPTVQEFGASSNLNIINNGVNGSTVLNFSSYVFSGVSTDTLEINGVLVSLAASSFANFVTALNGNVTLNAIVSITSTTSPDTVTFTLLYASPLIIDITTSGTITENQLIVGISPDKVLYNKIVAALEAFAMELYPSATMAGIYCSVDSTRGVWKAPANVGVSLVDSLNRIVKDSDQSDLNVDSTSGKSIDVIRNFPGRGNLVWGARTLDGNSNEWRYVNVRRTFIMIEESCKKATMFSVFEPNDKGTWLRIQGMISNFLTTMWRDGALAGSKPEQAFFVKVGLGETMTALDILEGRLIVQIGLAVVRPAEFIILQFEHKLQEA